LEWKIANQSVLLCRTSCKLSKDDDSKDADQRQYISMIGNLLYVTTSRPDVMQEVGQVARFQATPKESHVMAVKRIFRYLKGTKEFGLWYPKGNDLSLFPTQMQIGQVALMIEEVQVEQLSTWVSVWYHG
jgi:hypothetical protein